VKRTSELLGGAYRNFLFPTILIFMAMNMAEFVDAIIVSNMLGASALAVINVYFPILLIYVAVSQLFGTGASVLYARLLGELRREDAGRLYTLTLAAMTLCSLLLTGTGLALKDPVISLLTGGAAFDEGHVAYYTTYICGAPLFIVLFGLTYMMRSDGYPGIASAVIVICNAVNLVMDVVYIRCGMGVQGAALATLTGYFTGFLTLAAAILARKASVPLRRFHAADMGALGQALYTGLSSLAIQALSSVKIIAINRRIAGITGADGVASFAICMSALAFASIFIGGAANAMSPISSVLYGEKDYAGIRLVMKRALLTITASTAVIVALFEAFPGAVLAVFGAGGEALLDSAIAALRIYAPSIVTTGFIYLTLYYAQATARRNLALVVGVLEGCAAIAFLYPLSAWIGLDGVWACFFVSDLFIVAVILCCISRTNAVSGSRGLFMLPAQPDIYGPHLSATVHQSKEEAVAFSSHVYGEALKAGADKSRATLLSLLVEEMAVFLMDFSETNGERCLIDILVKFEADKTVISFKSGGKPIQPTELAPDVSGPYNLTNISMVRRIASELHTDYVIGLNITVITLLNKKADS
jgi:Na+-driven multidrug efflux pump